MNAAAILIISALSALLAYSLSRENHNYHKWALYGVSVLSGVSGLVAWFAKCLV